MYRLYVREASRQEGGMMRKPDDGMMLIHDHLVEVCMDLVEVDEEDRDETKQDFVEMVELFLESLQLRLSTRVEQEPTIQFNCNITIPKE